MTIVAKRNVFRSETIKFYSNKWCLVGVIITVFIAPIILLFSGTNFNVMSNTLQNFFLSQAGVVVVSSAYFGQEYSNSYLRTSLLSTPNRQNLFFCKLFLLTVSIWLTGLVSSLICIGIGVIRTNLVVNAWFLRRYFSHINIALLSWVFISLITASLVIIFKSQIFPMASMFSLIMGLDQLLFASFKIAKYLPDLSMMNAFLLKRQNVFVPVNQGILVQMSWVLVLMIIAYILFKCRDI